MMHALNIFEEFICFLGAKIETDFHQHYAIAVLLSHKQPFSIITPDSVTSSTFCILPPNYYHRVDASKVDNLILLLVEPDSKYSYFLRQSINSTSTIQLIENFSSVAQTFLNKQQAFDRAKVAQFLEAYCTSEPISPIDPRINKIFQYTKNHLFENLTSQTLAQQVHLSESRFRHLFKKEVGISVSKYLQWLRLKKAGELILYGDNLTRASHSAGFYDAAHFNRIFKEMFGIPPSKVLV